LSISFRTEEASALGAHAARVRSQDLCTPFKIYLSLHSQQCRHRLDSIPQILQANIRIRAMRN